MAKNSYNVASLAKGLRLLSVFSQQHRQLRLVELAELTGLPVPTVFRLVKTLEAEGYVEQLGDSRYRPGSAVLSLGYAALQDLDVAEASAVPLQQLADTTNETINLGILVGANVLYIQRVKNTDLVTANIQVGSLLPACCTSIGKLLFALLDGDDLERRLGAVDFQACTGPRAPTSTSQLRAALKDVRRRGWALQDEEIAHGLRSIAAPVRDHRGSAVAGLNVAVQASRWSAAELVEHFLEPLLEAADQASRRLGYTNAPAPAART